MLTEILNKIIIFNDKLFGGLDSLINSFGMSEWISDAILDSLHILPLLFILFLIIELVEFFYAEKINTFIKQSERIAPIIGSFAAIIPQCGFSIIASTLYVRRFITKGTLIGIYLATSDEAIPILLVEPNQIKYVLPIIIIKFCLGVSMAYLIDFILKDKKYILIPSEIKTDEYEEDGCCHHGVIKRRKRDLLYHPFFHTMNVFVFILLITLFLNFCFMICDKHTFITQLADKIHFIEPVFMSFLGLIPNCATSIAIIMLFIKGSISFGATIAGLLTNAGLGLLILIKEGNKKDTLQIISILLLISIITGMLLQTIGF